MMFYAKENIASLFSVFFMQSWTTLLLILSYPSFVNTMERLYLYQLIALKKIFFAPRNP